MIPDAKRTLRLCLSPVARILTNVLELRTQVNSVLYRPSSVAHFMRTASFNSLLAPLTGGNFSRHS